MRLTYDLEVAGREMLAFARLLVKLGFTFDQINRDWLPPKTVEINEKLKGGGEWAKHFEE